MIVFQNLGQEIDCRLSHSRAHDIIGFDVTVHDAALVHVAHRLRVHVFAKITCRHYDHMYVLVCVHRTRLQGEMSGVTISLRNVFDPKRADCVPPSYVH